MKIDREEGHDMQVILTLLRSVATGIEHISCTLPQQQADFWSISDTSSRANLTRDCPQGEPGIMPLLVALVGLFAAASRWCFKDATMAVGGGSLDDP